jgi:hypothetical protein
MSVSSYNAGYHRGLNSEYHREPIEKLYKEWVESTEFLLVPVTFDPVAFEEGYEQGLADYFGDKPDAFGLYHNRVHKDLGNARAAKTVKVKNEQ